MRRMKSAKAGTAPLNKLAAADDDVSAFLEDLDVEMRSRCRLIEFEAERQADAVKNAFSSELIKLPKSIRNMSVREFYQKYNGDISLVLEEEKREVLGMTGFSPGNMGSVVLQSAQAIATSMKKRKATSSRKLASNNTLRAKAAQNSAVKRSQGDPPLATPNRDKGVPGVFATPRFETEVVPETPATSVADNSKMVRRMKRGESIMSVNGSPLVSFEDEDGADPQTSEKQNMGLQTPGGHVINIADPSLKDKLLKDDKTKEMIHGLYSQFHELMQSVHGSKDVKEPSDPST